MKTRNQHKFGEVITEGEIINPSQSSSINKPTGDLLEELLAIVNTIRTKNGEKGQM
jgi:hypothetical protein